MDQRLTPIMPRGKTNDGHIKWLFICICGNTKEIAMSRVNRGLVKSCGCLSKETKTNFRHGYKGTSTYSSWSSAKDRTTNPKSKDFHRYGAIGITMHTNWMVFENFLRDMGEKPEGTSLDRIDGSKGYEPGNCRWATSSQQMRNRKDNVYLQTESGQIFINDYAEKLGITRGAALLRLKRGKLEGVLNTISYKERILNGTTN